MRLTLKPAGRRLQVPGLGGWAQRSLPFTLPSPVLFLGSPRNVSLHHTSHRAQGTLTRDHSAVFSHSPKHGFQNAQLRLSKHSRNSGPEGGSSGPRRERLPSVCEALGLMSMHISGQGDTGLPQQVGVGQRVRSSRSFLVSSKPAWVIGDPVRGKQTTPTPQPQP